MMHLMNEDSRENGGNAGDQGISREEALFNEALGLAPANRPAFLEKACGSDTALHCRLERLLHSHEEAGTFLENSAPIPSAAELTQTIPVVVPPSEKPGDVIGRYKIREMLGEGGCGVVYVAEQTEPVRRRVALKIIKLGMDTRSVIARFEAERQALALMDHPNIAKVLDAGTTTTGRPYFVMELVRGIRITDYCDQNHLDTRQRLKLFVQVCHAVQHAHQKAIIHRDLKPSNILVTLHDGVPVPKIIDFGIAKATEGRLTDLTIYTELHQFIGTPAYMSPEQAEMSGLDIDTRSDIYSLGVLLYELLTGQTPFDARTLVKSGIDEMRRTIREQDPERPSTRLLTMMEADLTATARRHGSEPPKLVHAIRGDLDWVAMKALEKDRTRRYETASALALDVQRFLGNEPIEARPPSNLYRFQKLVRRNKGVFAASGAIAATLILGLVVAIYLYIQENKAYQRAVAAEREQARLRTEAEMGLAMMQKLTKAGDLISRGHVDEADVLMQEIPAFPSTFIIYDSIGYIRGITRNYPKAIVSYSKSISVEPTDYRAYHCLAPLLVQVGQLGDYRDHCARMLRQFENSSDPLKVARIAQDCLLAVPTESSATLNAAGKLADTALAGSSNHLSRRFIEMVKGLAEYRQGRFTTAGPWLKNAASQREQLSDALAANAILAMTQVQLGAVSEAQATVAAAGKINEAMNSVLETQDGNEQLAARLLMREAQSMIQLKTAGNAAPQ
jgi:eukaryotic-like serine/threonine-protein kinase